MGIEVLPVELLREIVTLLCDSPNDVEAQKSALSLSRTSKVRGDTVQELYFGTLSERPIGQLLSSIAAKPFFERVILMVPRTAYGVPISSGRKNPQDCTPRCGEGREFTFAFFNLHLPL